MSRSRMAGMMVALLATLPTTSVEAQEVAGELPAESVAEPPAMPEAPLDFSLALVASGHLWDEGTFAGAAVEDRPALGFEVERRVLDYLAFRVGVGYASPEVSSASRAERVDQWTVELTAVGRLALESLVRRGVVPLVTLGYGSLVHSPDDDELRSRNQSLFAWGAGVEWEPLERFGARAEWRRGRVDRSPLFDPTARTSEQHDLDRWVVGVYWRF